MNSVTTLWTIWYARYWILVSVIVACVAATGAAFVGASPTGATDRVGSMTASLAVVRFRLGRTTPLGRMTLRHVE